MNFAADLRTRAGRRVLAVYKYAISPFLHSISRTVSGPSAGCRFHPTCSEYAAQAYSLHGSVRGSLLAMGRVLRCHPFARGGHDPVPEAGAGVTPRKTKAI